MTQTLILHRKSDGSRVLVAGGYILDERDAADDDSWPYLETFDEVANALQAMHVLTPEEVTARQSAVVDERIAHAQRFATTNLARRTYVDPYRDAMIPDEHLAPRAQHANQCPAIITLSGSETTWRCERVVGHDGEHDADLPF